VQKPSFTWNSHSRSFSVIHFAISYRATRGSISSYNIAGLNSEVSEEVATQIAKNCRRRQPHSHLRPPPRGTPASIRIPYSLFPETRVIGLHFCRWLYGSIIIQICAVGSKRRIFSATECVLAVQGRSRSSKVDDFSTNRKRVCDFLLVDHCDYGHILHRFWDTATYWLKLPILNYFSYPSLIRRPSSPCSLLNFTLKLGLTIRKLESWVKTPWS